MPKEQYYGMFQEQVTREIVFLLLTMTVFCKLTPIVTSRRIVLQSKLPLVAVVPQIPHN